MALEGIFLPRQFAYVDAFTGVRSVIDSIALLSICLWAGALLAILVLMVYLWRWSSKNGRRSPTPRSEPAIKTPPRDALPPAPQPSPEENESAFRKGRELVHTGQAEEGSRALQKIVAAAPDHEEAWFWLAIAAVRLKDYRAAERCFLQAKKHGHPGADQALAWLRKQG